MRTALQTHLTALRALAVATIVLGIAYTFAVTGVAQLLLPAQASGSLVERDGEVVGSALIGQSWLDAEGEPLPEWFQGRPSAAGDGYDGGASSGSNLGPEHPDLIAAIAERRAAIAAFEGVEEATIPADALTASGSGLDPHISPEYALLQAPRVAEARELPTAEVVELVERRIAPRDLGILGQPRVNVLELNLALDELAGR